MLAVSRVSEVALAGGVAAGEDDVLSRLRQLRHTLQECSLRVTRVDIALRDHPSLAPQTNPQATSSHHNGIESTRNELTKENTVGADSLGGEDTTTSIISGDVSLERDGSGCVRIREGTERRDDIKEKDIVSSPFRCDSKDITGNESCESKLTLRPQLVRQQRFEQDESEDMDMTSAGSFTSTIPKDDSVFNDCHIMSGDIITNTGFTFQPNMDDNNLGDHKSAKQDSSKRNAIMECVYKENENTIIRQDLEIMVSADVTNIRRDNLVEDVKEEQQSTTESQPIIKHDSENTFETQENPEENTPETLQMQQDQQQTSSRYETQSDPQHNSSVSETRLDSQVDSSGFEVRSDSHQDQLGTQEFSDPHQDSLESEARQLSQHDPLSIGSQADTRLHASRTEIERHSFRTKTRPDQVIDSPDIIYKRSDSEEATQSTPQQQTPITEAQYNVEENYGVEEEKWELLVDHYPFFDSICPENLTQLRSSDITKQNIGNLRTENAPEEELQNAPEEELQNTPEEQLQKDRACISRLVTAGKLKVVTEGDEIHSYWDAEGREPLTPEGERLCSGWKVDKQTDSRVRHSDTHHHQLQHQQTWAQDVRRSLVAVSVVFLLLFLLLVLACCLILVVPVVTISVRTFGGPPAF